MTVFWVLVIGTALLITSASASAAAAAAKAKARIATVARRGSTRAVTSRAWAGSAAAIRATRPLIRPHSAEAAAEPGGGMTMTMGGADQIFDSMAKEHNSISRSELDARGQGFFDMLARSGNISGDTITRQQFTAASTMQAGPAAVAAVGAAVRTPTDQSGRRIASAGWTWIRTGSSTEEMSANLGQNRKQYDTNNDGAIDLDEFKVYMADMTAQRPERELRRGSPDDGLPGGDGRPSLEEIRKPVVLPTRPIAAQLPDWFEQMDGDRDGQVGLYEWVKDGRSVDEFKGVDRNDDGFLTVEEVMADQRAQNRQPGDSTSMYARSDNSNVGGRGGMGFGGPGGGRGRGPGGPNGDMGGGRGPGGGRGRGGFGGPNSDASQGGSDQAVPFWMQNGGPGGGRGRGGFGGPDAQGGGPGGGRRGRGGPNGDNANGGIFGAPGGGRRGFGGFGGGNGNE